MKQWLTISFSLLLAACGGGSDTSGGAGTTADSTAPVSNQTTDTGASTPAESITYVGTGTVTLTAPGIPPITNTAAVTLIRQGSTVTAIVDGESVTTTVNGDSFSARVPISESQDGINCSGIATVNGTFTGNVVNATLSGNGNCTGQGLTVPVTVNGSLGAQAQ